MREKSRIELWYNAISLILLGVEPRPGESVDDFVKRGEEELRRLYGQECEGEVVEA